MVEKKLRHYRLLTSSGILGSLEVSGTTKENS